MTDDTDLHELAANLREVLVRLGHVETNTEAQTKLLDSLTKEVGGIKTQITMIKGGGAGIIGGGAVVGWLLANWQAFKQVVK